MKHIFGSLYLLRPFSGAKIWLHQAVSIKSQRKIFGGCSMIAYYNAATVGRTVKLVVVE